MLHIVHLIERRAGDSRHVTGALAAASALALFVGTFLYFL